MERVAFFKKNHFVPSSTDYSVVITLFVYNFAEHAHLLAPDVHDWPLVPELQKTTWLYAAGTDNPHPILRRSRNYLLLRQRRNERPLQTNKQTPHTTELSHRDGYCSHSGPWLAARAQHISHQVVSCAVHELFTFLLVSVSLCLSLALSLFMSSCSPDVMHTTNFAAHRARSKLRQTAPLWICTWYNARSASWCTLIVIEKDIHRNPHSYTPTFLQCSVDTAITIELRG